MTAVECSSKSGPYRRQVSAGALASEPLTGKNISVGLRATCTIQFTAAQTATSRTVATMILTATGALLSATSARPVKRLAAERRARWRRARVARGSACEIVAYAIIGTLLLQSGTGWCSGDSPSRRQTSAYLTRAYLVSFAGSRSQSHQQHYQWVLPTLTSDLPAHCCADTHFANARFELAIPFGGL